MDWDIKQMQHSAPKYKFTQDGLTPRYTVCFKVFIKSENSIKINIFRKQKQKLNLDFTFTSQIIHLIFLTYLVKLKLILFNVYIFSPEYIHRTFA